MFIQVSSVGKIELKRNAKYLLLSVLFLFSLQAAEVSAKTLSVPESSPTIKGALIKAKPGDIVLVACGTYYEHDITMKPGVALWSGTLQPGCVTIDAQGKGRVFLFADADTTTALVGFTLTGGLKSGKKGGAVFCKNSSPRISNCVFLDNSAENGGAFFSDSSSSPVISNCLFENNQAQTGGGAQCQGSAVFRQCAFLGNTAMSGGALNAVKDANVTLASCSLRENSAGNTGGAVHVSDARLIMTSTIISDNWGGIGGNAISSNNAVVEVINSTLFRNQGDTDSGVLAFAGQKPLLRNSIIAYSKSDILRFDSDVPIFKGCNLFGNEAGDWTANLRPLRNRDKNISIDPQFCAPEFGNFSLKNSSACLPGNNPSGNSKIVGAFGPGCASVDNRPQVQRRSPTGFQAVQAGL